MIDWDSYQDTFPTRYFRKGLLDEKVEAYLSQRRGLKILDVGAGVAGTPAVAVAHEDHQVWFVDVGITKWPAWVRGVVRTCDDIGGRTFDLIVCRRSINYLSPTDIMTLGMALAPGGYLVANTVADCPADGWRSAYDVHGRALAEVVRVEDSQVTPGKLVRHRLIRINENHDCPQCDYGGVPPGEEIADHTFFWYSQTQYLEWLTPPCVATCYGDNSLLLEKWAS